MVSLWKWLLELLIFVHLIVSLWIFMTLIIIIASAVSQHCSWKYGCWRGSWKSERKIKGFYFCAQNLVSVTGNQNYSFWFSDHMPHSSNSNSRKIFENLNLSLPVLILCLQGDMHNLKALFWWGFLIARSSD